ncbi:segregation and condensation protein A [Streptomyces chilikensis]|uniref:Segregation and condensation protein A n=1 Tax=Streptomyces chilikensis TaxID=1194079 RepID=A0ABV3EPF1_9ACTN
MTSNVPARRRPLGRGPARPPAPASPAPAPDDAPEPHAAPAPVEAPEGSRAAPAPDRAAPDRAPETPGGTPATTPPATRGPDPAEPAPGPPHSGPAGAGATAAAPPQAPAHPHQPSAAAGEPADDPDTFTVRLTNFEGPFDLLLQLIAKHKLDVTEVALSQVTDEFMAHVRARGDDWDLDRTTEFLVVAATLLDLKAARLLPAAEVEDEADLALLEARDLLFARLLQYRAYKQIADILGARLEDESRRHPRTVGLEPHHAELLPDVVLSIGPEGFARLAVKAMQPKPPPQVYVDHIHAPLVSVREQAAVVTARLREVGEATFGALVADTDDTLTVVARFLALLELYREKAVALEQETALGELLVRWTGDEDGPRPVVTDEFDRPAAEATTKEERA